MPVNPHPVPPPPPPFFPATNQTTACCIWGSYVIIHVTFTLLPNVMKYFFFSKFSQIFHICMFPPIIGLFCTYFSHPPYFSTIAFTMFITIRNILWFQRKYLSWAQKRGSVSLLGLPFYSVQQQKVNFYLICEAPQWAASRNSTQTWTEWQQASRC